MEMAYVLIQQAQEICDGEAVHNYANLVGMYRASLKSYHRTQNADFLQIAEESLRGFYSLNSGSRRQN